MFNFLKEIQFNLLLRGDERSTLLPLPLPCVLSVFSVRLRNIEDG